jgi:hypothetical protein
MQAAHVASVGASVAADRQLPRLSEPSLAFTNQRTPPPAPPMLHAPAEPPAAVTPARAGDEAQLPSLDLEDLALPTPAPPFVAPDAAVKPPATAAPSSSIEPEQQQRPSAEAAQPPMKVSLMGRGLWTGHGKVSFPVDPEVPPAWGNYAPAAFCNPEMGLEPTDSGGCVCMQGGLFLFDPAAVQLRTRYWSDAHASTAGASLACRASNEAAVAVLLTAYPASQPCCTHIAFRYSRLVCCCVCAIALQVMEQMPTCAHVPGAPWVGTAEEAKWVLPSASPARSCPPPTPAGPHAVSSLCAAHPSPGAAQQCATSSGDFAALKVSSTVSSAVAKSTPGCWNVLAFDRLLQPQHC